MIKVKTFKTTNSSLEIASKEIAHRINVWMTWETDSEFSYKYLSYKIININTSIEGTPNCVELIAHVWYEELGV